MKHILMILLILTCSMWAQSQKTMTWSDIPLTWNDFTPREHKTSGKTAGVFINTRYSIESMSSATEVVVDFESKVTQVKESSYVLSKFLKESPKANKEDLLRHEKGHLVNAFIKQLWLQDTLSKAKFNANTFKQQLKDIFSAIEKRGDALDKKYDSETNHSTIVDQQTIWEDRLLAMLNELNKGRKGLPWSIKTTISIKK